MAKLWQKNYTVDSLLEEFTVGIDYKLDLELVRADCMGSIAHAAGIRDIGILTRSEFESLERELRVIADDSLKGVFQIAQSDEDCHTAIESRLTQKLGDVGKKVHTGRSRNDQVLTALRLHTRSALLDIRASLLSLIDRLVAFAKINAAVPMPGRTHMQIAMPSSVGLWAGALAEQLYDDYRLLMAAWEMVDRSPLGSSASYGVPLDLDRDASAERMGFSGPMVNVLYAGNSRGKVEAVVLDALDHIGISLSKYAQDLILFSLPEFGYFSLPDKLCTGSSIMPQKKNPDGLELLRSRSALLSGWATQVKMIVRSLPTGYNRDFQDTKEALLRGLNVARNSIRIMELTFAELKVNRAALEKAFTPEIYATDEALRLVAEGMPFRDAYVKVGTNLEAFGNGDPAASIASRTHVGTSGNLGLERLEKRLLPAKSEWDGDAARVNLAIQNLLGDAQGV